jgi:glycosyltransferase involved in cell wall biosynthesis
MSKVCIIQYNASKFLTRVDRAARTLAEAGYEVVLVAIKDDETSEFEQRDGYVVRRITLKSRQWTRRFGLKYVRFLEGIWRTYRAALAENADVYDARDAYPLLVAWRAARKRRAKLVYDADELATGRNWAHASNPVFAWAIRSYERFLCRRADAVITSDYGRADVMERLHGIPRPTVILNVPEIADALEPDLEWAADARGDRRYLLIYQGIVIVNRGIPEMIDAMRELPDCRLAVVGSGSLLPKAKEQVVSAGLEDAVRFYDPVPFATLMRYTAAADVGVIPLIGSCESYRTAAPNKLFEYMAAGIPVVATDLPDMARVVREARCGTLIAEPVTPASIVAAVRELLEGDESLEVVGERGRRAAAVCYNWDVERPKLLAVFEGLVPPAPAPPAPTGAAPRAGEAGSA